MPVFTVFYTVFRYFYELRILNGTRNRDLWGRENLPLPLNQPAGCIWVCPWVYEPRLLSFFVWVTVNRVIAADGLKELPKIGANQRRWSPENRGSLEN